MTEPRLPLEGIRVLAVEQFIAGPLCSMWLGDLGAEVIKIETPGVGDPRRSFPPMLRNSEGDEISGGFMAYNRNKKSVTLNLKTVGGRRVYKDLVARADIVVENLKPGTVDRLGLGYEVLKEVNPRLIYAALSGFGRMESLRGPYSDRPAFDAVVQAMGGVMHRIGEADGPPMLAVAGTADRLSAIVAGYAIFVALFMRERTGVGQFVDAAMYDSTMVLNEAAIAVYAMTGNVLTRGKDELYAPVGGFKVKDGWIGLIIPGEDMWVRFCRAIGRTDLAEHALCKGSQNRARNYKSFLKPIVEEWMARHTREEVVQILMEHGVPAGAVQTSADLFACPSEYEAVLGKTLPAKYALRAKRHMQQYGTTATQLAMVSVKNHEAGALNPMAHYQHTLTLEEVLASRPVADPLTLLQCCPTTDGAAAVVVVSEALAGRIQGKPVRIAASAVGSGAYRNAKKDGISADDDITVRAATKAYEMAGLGPDDVQVAEVHDAFTIGEILACENLALCPRGEGGPWAAEGITALGGRLPVNPSGGLLSRGHPLGASGVAQVVELTWQLQGRCGARQVKGVKVALAHVVGGSMPGVGSGACAIHILTA